MSNRKLCAALAAAIIFGSLLSVVMSVQADPPDDFKATLTGFEEVPAISTAASGSFSAELSPDGTSITFTLTYSGLTAPATASHIHLGQMGVNGGVIIFLCGGPTPACPAGTTTPATVTGTRTAANVVGPSSQGIAAGEFAEFVAALQAGVTYVNVHNSVFPGGEIRGQIND